MEKVPAEGPMPILDTPGDEPCAQIWSVYISEAEKYDKALVDSWRANMNGMLIFAGLFSAILTAFIIESYKNLQPDTTSQMTLMALVQISHQLANSTNTIPFNATQMPPSPPKDAALICNILWFISLGLSLASALTATLVDQWAREFLQRTEMLPSPVKRARIFAYLYYGLKRFRMHAVVGVVPLLLHMSLLFFFGGLVAFLYPINKTVAGVAAGILGIVMLLYASMTALPLVRFDCPYKTPLSTVLWSVYRYFSLLFLRRFPSYKLNHDDSPHLHSMISAMVETATVRSDHREERDKLALAWTMKSLADDDELEPFVEGIPNAIWGPQGRRGKYDNLIRGLLNDPDVLLGSRIEHLMLSCESGLLEPNAKTRRQISCLKAIWCFGMMAEKNSMPVQPLFFLQGSRFLPPKTSITAPYLASIAALADWNTLCSLHGHVEKLTASVRAGEAALAEGRLPDIQQLRVGLLNFLAELHRCQHSIPITGKGMDLDLDQLCDEKVVPLPMSHRSSSDWIEQVSQILDTISTHWNGVQYRVLLSFFQQAADLDTPPYEFELTCKTIGASLQPVDIPVGYVATTFVLNVRKAVQTQAPSINHVDVILGILLPWFDAVPDIELAQLNHVTDSVVEYVNNRNSNEAICRVLRDCNLTRIWNRVTARLSTCRPESSGDVSKAIWQLAALFPEQSAPAPRLSIRPSFNGKSLSVVPVAPYSASVLALLKTHILSAYEDEEADIISHLQALDTQITAHEQHSSSPLMAQLRVVEGDWALLNAISSLLLSFPTFSLAGRPMEPLKPFPPYTVQTHQAYGVWRVQALAAIHDALELIPRFYRRIDEARLVVTTEFIQACCSAGDSTLPYKALETFFESLLPVLYVSRPTHPTNQTHFATALRNLAETPEIPPDHLRLLQALIGSHLFNSEELPWLDDRNALSVIRSVLSMTLAFIDGGSATQSRKLDDIRNWLERKERMLMPTKGQVNYPLAGPS
ncbi:hypothetical protein C8R44DRAFT_788116 [Mycena epipterygia]|nr:hypothetical protein C8R44DRAFT_788116 [Mycena epipterygia]